MKKKIIALGAFLTVGIYASWGQTTVTARMVQGAECLLPEILESIVVLNPCSTPSGWENLVEGDTIILTYTEGSCMTFCMQGTEVDVSSFELQEPSAGINDLNKTEIRIYPQPATDQLTVQTDCTIETIRILNLQGELVMEQLVNTKSFTLPLSTIESGIYLVEVKTQKGLKVQQIVKK